MNPMLDWIRETPLGEMMRESPDLFPACETLHFIGLSLLIGVMLVVDLRVLGQFRQASYASVFRLLPLALIGFAISAITGACFIAANPALYFTNPAFFAKLAFIALAGANALLFTLAEHRSVASLGAEVAAPYMARLMAGVSLTSWVLVLLLGRLLPTFAPIGGG